jgi:hypothetical protein
MSQKRAAIYERAARAAAMTFTLTLGRYALPDVFAMENRKVGAAELAQDL